MSVEFTTGIPLSWFLLVSATLFTIGVIGILVKRNAIVILMSIELMLNAANINFVAFSAYYDLPWGRCSRCSPSVWRRQRPPSAWRYC